MIQARIRKSYAGFSLDLNLEAASGVTALFGPSGAGKTVTLDCIAGFVCPDGGRILLDDRILFDSESRVHLPPRVRKTGYVFQNYALFPHMSLRQNLEFAAAKQPRRVDEMLERFRLTEVADRRPHALSGGQKQRCSIARALIGEPRLLLLDEPARGLDAPLRAELYAVLRQVRAEFGTPAILVTHDLEECFQLADELLVLHEGRLVQTGTPRAVLEQPANVEVARLLGRFNLMQVEIRALDPGRNTCCLRYGPAEIHGPYLPGHLLGDRVWLCTRPEALLAYPRQGSPGPNQVPATLLRRVEIPSGERLEFSDEIAVEFRLGQVDRNAPAEWMIEFPPHSIHVVDG